MIRDLCFEIIEACPNNCKFCSSNANINKRKIIKLEDFKRVIDYFYNSVGIEELSLSGGEPFLHPNLLQMVEYASNLGIRTVIFTSGVIRKVQEDMEYRQYLIEAMNKRLETIKKYDSGNIELINQVKRYYLQKIEPCTYTNISRERLFELKEAGLNKIVFDYQAQSHDIDCYLMGRDENQQQIFSESLFEASVSGLDVSVHFIPMKPNYKEIGDILEILEIAKIKNISILNFIPQGRGAENHQDLELSSKELKKFLKLLDKYKKIYSGNIKLGISLQNNPTHKCNAGLDKIDIKFDGTVLPCPAFKELSEDELKKYGIKLYNIYDNLEEIKIPGKGTREEPLCRKIYKR